MLKKLSLFALIILAALFMTFFAGFVVPIGLAASAFTDTDYTVELQELFLSDSFSVETGQLDDNGHVSVRTVYSTGYSGPTSFHCSPLIPSSITNITSYFGEDRGLGHWNHTGIDYGTNFVQGLAVNTPMGGEVVFTGIYGDWGNTVVIENAGYQILLSHLSDITVFYGQIVYAGEAVATSGGNNQDNRDGKSSGAHLHFEVRRCQEDSCKIMNPSTVLLPGQIEICDWTLQVTKLN